MKLITELFKNRQEKTQINKMLVIAAHENILEQHDIDLLTKEITFFSYKDLTNDQTRIQNLKQSLPTSAKEKFKVAYLLLTSLMVNGAISESKEEIVSNLIQIMNVPKEKANELIQYLKSNIKNGLNFDDAYMRLGYLLDTPKYA